MALSFGIIGSGWRAEFFLRIARDLPEQFPLAGVVARNPDKRAELGRRWAAPTFSTLDELLTERRPDFVVTSVSASANLEWMETLSERGVPVLSETPIGRDLKELHRVVDLERAGARVQVAEQYLFQPLHAARLALIESGKLGTIHETDVSIAHGYHGVSLLRHFLQTGLRLPKITARRFTSRIVAGPHRNRLPAERKMVESVRTIAQLDYGDRLGIYDFTGDQYHSWIRSPRLMVRGEEGEINQTTVRLLKRFDTPFQFDLVRRDTGHAGNLEGYSHRSISGGGEVLYENPYPAMRWNDDEIAVATSLTRMATYVTTGEPAYSAAEACHDCYLDQLIEEAATSGQVVVGETQPWM
ncbi:MAG: Gfo/Idh/MocA family oxidoreductase [Verrucomicrobia bacterium]|nr:Gfo/Idh/MocA family oxidoreductase [Verrucomicrobiota bacterium]MBV8486594.1 Gfo/Idh/MocA family oxidoreductase [Verrucomicrobiota bacterium]